MKKIKIGLSDFIGLAVSVFFLALTLRDFTFEPTAIPWNKTTVILLAAAFLLTIMPTYFNAIRFRLFFAGKQGEFKRVRTFPSYFVGHFYNAVLPGNLGEGVKIYHLSKKYSLNHKDVLAYWFCEKYLDSLVLPVIIIPPLFLLKNVYMQLLLSGLLSLIALAILYVYIGKRVIWIKKLPFRLLPIKKVRRYIYSIFVRFLKIYNKFYEDKRLFLFLGISLFFYFLVLVYNYVVILLADLPATFLSVESLMLLGTMLLLTHFVPSAPSSAGVLHYGVYSSLIMLATHYNVEVSEILKNKFVIASMYFHFILFFSDVIIGSYFVYRERKWLFAKKNVAKNE